MRMLDYAYETASEVAENFLDISLELGEFVLNVLLAIVVYGTLPLWVIPYLIIKKGVTTMQNDMRDRLIELINQDNCPSPYICDEKCKYSHLGQCIGDRLADYLIANDVVPVVRCRGCKYYEIHKPSVTLNCERGGRLVPMMPDDYCSYGERKCDNG